MGTANGTFEWHYTILDDRNFQIHGHTLFFIIVVFSVVIAATLLVLYTRWLCRYRDRHVSDLPTTSHAPGAAPPPRKGLDPDAIKGLPVVLHKSSSAAKVPIECSICLGVFEDGEKLKVLPRCCHCYHPECVDKWLISQSSCPLCRASLRVDSADSRIVIV
ncbi:hypothetical protein UlMin_019288 [Ulmus minor]